MTDERLHQAESVIGHRFRDPSLLARALTHASIADSRLESNERLEFLGDAVLGMIACERIFQSFPELLEGEMTKIKSTVVSRQTCAMLSKKIGLDAVLHLGKGMRADEELPQSLTAAVLESVTAAIYLDGGLDAARRFLIPLLDPVIRRAEASGHQENFKSVLQQYAQQILGDTPVYNVLDEKGPDHAKCFEICVEIGIRRFDSSWGPSKKQAEQQAAFNALSELGVVEIDEKTGHARVVRTEGAEESEDQAQLQE